MKTLRRNELLAYVSIFAGGMLLLSHLDGFELLYEYTRAHEEYELDELILSLPLLLACALVFSWRRVGDLRRERQACREARRELAKSCSALENMALFREDFILKACEKLKKPLTDSLQALNEMTPVGGVKNERALNATISTMENMSRIVDDISSAIQPAGDGNGDTQLRLSNLFESVRLQTQAQADAKGLSLHFTKENDIPNAYECNASHLRIALLTLVENAIQHTDKGRVCVYASYAPDDARSLLITVSDTGVGIPKEGADRIFDAGYGMKRPENLKDCFGTNLAMAHKLVERSGGSLSLTDKTDQGTEFFISFPASQDDA